MKALHTPFCAAALLLPALAHAVPDEITPPRLVTPPGETYWTASDALTIVLPTQYPEASTLHLELDAVDVSALMRFGRDNQSVEFRPAAPLKPGLHQLRLVEETQQGQLLELAIWDLEARESAAWQSYRTQYALSVSGGTQLAHSDSIPRDRHIRTNGSLRVEGTGNTGLGKLAVAANVTGDSNSFRTGRDVGLMLGSFQASASSADAVFTAGDHAPVPPGGAVVRDLVFDGGTRRGISYAERLPTLRSNFSAYSFGADPVNGFRNGFAFSNPDNRITGGHYELLPWASGNNALSVAMGFVHGQGTRGGSTVGTADGGVVLRSQGVSGEAGNATAEAKLLDGSLAMHAEYARSRRSVGFDLGTLSDTAQVYAVNYQTPEGFVLGANTLTWSGTYSHQRIGTLFRSVADPGGAVDVLGDKATLALQYGTVALDVSAARAHDNVDSLPFARTLISNYATNLSWSPTLQQDTMPAWLTQPTLTLSWGEDRRHLGDAPPDAVVDPFDNSNRIGALQLGFSHPYGGWSISYNYSSAKDRTGLSCFDVDGVNPPFCEARSSALGLDASFRLGERLSVSSQLQWNLQSERVRNIETRALSGSLGVTYAVIRDLWNVALSLSSNHSSVSDDSIDSQGESASLDSTWRYRWFGFSLSGSYQHQRDRTPADVYFENEFEPPMTLFQLNKQESWQVLGRFSFSLPGK